MYPRRLGHGSGRRGEAVKTPDPGLQPGEL